MKKNAMVSEKLDVACPAPPTALSVSPALTINIASVIVHVERVLHASKVCVFLVLSPTDI